MTMPQDAGALMRLGHDKNGFSGSDIRPWHMRGTYHSYKGGKIEYEGKYEEWWFSPTRYKLSFSSPEATQTDYANGNTLMRDGTQDWLGGVEPLLRASLVEPLPDAATLANLKLKRGYRSVAKVKFDCITLTHKTRSEAEPHFSSACFETTMPVLRIFDTGYSLQIRYNHIVFVQGHFIAHQIQVFADESLIADLDIESIELLPAGSENEIVVASSAVPVDLSHIAMKPTVRDLWPMPLVVAFPDFADAEFESANASGRGTIVANQDLTPEARARLNPPKFASELVTVKIRVRPDGYVDRADAVSGTVRVKQRAIDAARQWVFRQVTVMGEARPLETEITLGVNWIVDKKE